MSQTPVVECCRLTKRYGRKIAVDALDLRVDSGDVFAFLGENGAGKTTTIRLMLGLQRADSGTVRLFGKTLAEDCRGALSRIGSLIEFPSLYGHLSGRDNVEIVRMLRGASPSETDRVLQTVGLSGDAGRPAGQYSQGMKQRLAIALALIGSPQLVVLDEPTNGLDPEGIREIRGLIQRLPQEYGATVFLSSHLLSEVEQTATKVAIIQKGRLLFQGTLQGLACNEGFQAEIEVDRPRQAANQLMLRGFDAEPQEGRLLVDCRPDQTAEVNRTLVHAGFSVSLLLPRKRSLEELYFALTRDREEQEC